MLDLAYVLSGITNGTVSITNMTPPQPITFYNDTNPRDVKLDRKYDVVRFQRDNINGRHDYHISVFER